jgi:hypothetical protein
MLLPKTTPSDKLGDPSIADVTPTKSSGNEVPRARIIAEIVKAPAFVSRLILLTPTITMSAALIRTSERIRMATIRPGTIRFI